jgi:hypothetical protein
LISASSSLVSTSRTPGWSRPGGLNDAGSRAR